MSSNTNYESLTDSSDQGSTHCSDAGERKNLENTANDETPVFRKRPGKAAKIPDNLLSPKDLATRNRRRRSNREAASRRRERRSEHLQSLSSEVEDLRKRSNSLSSENEKLKLEHEKLKMLLKLTQSPIPVNPIPVPAPVSAPSPLPVHGMATPYGLVISGAPNLMPSILTSKMFHARPTYVTNSMFSPVGYQPPVFTFPTPSTEQSVHPINEFTRDQ